MAGNTDLVSGDNSERKSHVAFSDSITVPSVEIVLSQLNSMVCVLKESVSHCSQSLSLSLSYTLTLSLSLSLSLSVRCVH